MDDQGEHNKEQGHSIFWGQIEADTDCSPLLLNPNFKQISDIDNLFLEHDFAVEEVKEAIWNCGSEKACVPNDFTFKFLKRYWSLIQDEIRRFVKYFEAGGQLARGCSSLFITLIPKIKDHLTLNDFRPIFLIGCFYKIIAKILANRIKKIIGMVIDETQAGFIENRNILDRPMIINEICSRAKCVKQKTFILK